MRGFLSVFLLLFFCSLSAQRPESEKELRDSVALGEIQVTAARYRQDLRSLAAPLQVVSSNQLQRASTGDLSAALASLPGVQLQSGTFQTLKLTLRGIGSRSQYGTNRSSVYINDIPLSGGDGTAVFDDLDVSFLSRAEVIKGTYSAWYGSGMGGSIRFITRTPTEKAFSAEAGITAGSSGLRKLNGMAFSNYTSGNLSVGLSHLHGDGYRANSAFSRTSALVSGKQRISTSVGVLSYLLMLSDVHAYTPSSIDYSTYINNPEAAAPNWLGVKGYKAYQRLLTGVKLETGLGANWSNTVLITATGYDQYELRPFNILDDNALSTSLQEVIRYRNPSLSAALGMEIFRESYDWQTRANGTDAVLTDAHETRRHVNVFASGEWMPISTLRFSLAANVNLTQYTLRERKESDLLFRTDQLTGKAIFSPMAGVVYTVTDVVSLYGSVGHGFSTPTVEESLSSDGTMNPGLRPEQGWTLDAGFRAWLPDSRLSVQGSVYTIFLDDLLVTKRPAEDVFYGENAGSAVLKGMELSIGFQPLDRLRFQLSSSLSNNTFKEFEEVDASFSGNHLPGIPRSQFYSSIELELPLQLRLNAVYRYSGRQFADDRNTITVDGWNTIDLGISFTTSLWGKLNMHSHVSVNNLLNEKYASMILINAPSFGGREPRYFYPAQPGNIALRVQLRWE
ncbi:MAG: TonB-dependent receptor [Paludibacter sp.]|nr:TonB-dependent receptor [Paludibacter sp.]